MTKLRVIPAQIIATQDNISSSNGVTMTSSSTGNPYMFVVDNTGVQLPVVQNNSYPHQWSFVYDPLRENMEWYGLDGYYDRQFVIMFSEILHRRVWRRKEFDDWFENECKETVFVQKQHQDMWLLTFINLDDLNSFKAWWLKERGQKFSMRNPFDRTYEKAEYHAFEQEVSSWFKDNCQSRYSLYCGYETITVEFEDDNEAVLLKLTWGDRCKISKMVNGY
jgi:hypothetical protein